MRTYQRRRQPAFPKQNSTKTKVLLWSLWRSGTHWLADMLTDLTHLPAVYASDDSGDYKQETIDQLYHWQDDTILVRHVCLCPDELLAHTEPLEIKVVFLFRDLRDVIASHVNMRKYREGYRPGLPPFPDMSVAEILAWEIERLRDRYTRVIPAWVEAEHPLLLKVRYEHLLQHTVAELEHLVRFLDLGVDRAALERVAADHGFAARSGRQPGEEDKSAHARKGIIGDYRAQFSRQEQQTLNELLGEALWRMGYEI